MSRFISSIPIGMVIVVVLALPATAADIAVTLRVTVPSITPSAASVFVAGDFQGWNPGHPRYELKPTDGQRHEIVISAAPDQPLQFKFTLGDWGRVEKGSAGEEIQNRLHVARSDTVLELTVAAWADGAARSASLSGDITQHAWPEVLDGRRVWVYLPPGYDDDPARRFPVLYMLDGQNVFDDATSFAGEWRVDETLEEMIPRGEVAPLIVVAVANGGDLRQWEYTPWNDPDRSRTGGGGDHLQTLIREIKPRVDAAYRTLTGPRDTGLAGSSFGGLMALYGAFAHADVFGRIGVFSPSLELAGGRPVTWTAEQAKPEIDLYVDMGTREGGNLHDADGNGVDDGIDSLHALQTTLIEKGFIGGFDLLVVAGEGHRHNEAFWSQRFPEAVRFLFPGK